MIWFHANFTDIEIGQNLIERGIDPQHIEISWIEPALRRLVEAAKKGGDLPEIVYLTTMTLKQRLLADLQDIRYPW